MSLFHVYIERPRSSAAGAATALAQAIAERYGIPVETLEPRLAKGRFRVKANVERTLADNYANDLARLGAVCTVVSADAPPPADVAPMSLPRVERIAAPPASAAAPTTASQVARSAAPPPVTRTPASSWPPVDAGAPQELGALSGEFPLTLSTLDGATEDEARASRNVKLPASFAPPAAERAAAASRQAPLPASFGPAPDDDGDEGGDVDMDDAPVDVFDPFAPPDQQPDAPELTLAVDHTPRKSKTMSETAPPAAGAPAPAPTAASGNGGHATSGSHAVAATMASMPPLPPVATPLPPPVAGPGGWKGPLRDDRTRLIAGAVLAVVIGAVPALLIGGARERAAFAQLDGDLDKRQSEIRTRDQWDGLDRERAHFLARKRAERQSIAITSLMIWVALGGAFTWLWFRKIDWDRVLA